MTRGCPVPSALDRGEKWEEKWEEERDLLAQRSALDGDLRRSRPGTPGLRVGAACLVLGIWASSAALAAPPVASGPGVRDLRGWDFAADGLASLAGEWAICWDALLTPERPDCPGAWEPVPVPALWSDPAIAGARDSGMGFATYRLRILLPEDAPPLSLRSGAPFTAFALWIDGRPHGGSGEVGRTPEDSTSRAHNRVFVIPEADSADSELTLEVQVSNHEFRGGGLRRQWLLGTRDAVRS
ncbi:MAG: hypothetical protein ACQGVK_03660 [Myxococcota bacterium]